MDRILQLFVLIPMLAFLLSLLLPRNNERIISRLVTGAMTLHLAAFTGFCLYWLTSGHPILDSKHITFFRSHNMEIFIDLYFDKVTAVYAMAGSLIGLLVTVFSRTYLHRDEGFKRFFSTLLLFFFGYNLTIFAGNYETLFIGWEILGVCSFLLIAFYRDRYLPIKNGLKVISVYRLGDMALILVMWMSHHLWHENITFIKFNNVTLMQGHLQEHSAYAVFIAVMIILAAAVKSAQLPFSSWLPRAMEGPTSSSAVFYGSLSVHMGVFLLLRTYPYWESMMAIKISVVAIGILTSIIAAGIARVQSSVKTQIAYSSITQIGLMFVEVAAGFHTLALIHFVGNAFLRTYQLLVSPSVLSYLIHNMMFYFKPAKASEHPGLIGRIVATLYILSLKEWNLDSMQYRYLWTPFKWLGRKLTFLRGKVPIALLTLLYGAGLYLVIRRDAFGNLPITYLPAAFALAGLLLVLRSFSERANPIVAWGIIVAGQAFITLSIVLTRSGFGLDYSLLYLSGVLISAGIGFICLKKIGYREPQVTMNRFHGHVYEHPVLGFVFLLSCLGLAGLPLTPAFIGMDLLFSHIHKQDILLISITALSFIFLEIAVLRIYARVFLGPHKKAYHPIAYRSS